VENDIVDPVSILDTHDNHTGGKTFSPEDKEKVLTWIKTICPVLSGSEEEIYRQFVEDKVLFHSFVENNPEFKISFKSFVGIKHLLRIRFSFMFILSFFFVA
jgi:hypothetical protein